VPAIQASVVYFQRTVVVLPAWLLGLLACMCLRDQCSR
jgi:hypothetical protein